MLDQVKTVGMYRIMTEGIVMRENRFADDESRGHYAT